MIIHLLSLYFVFISSICFAQTKLDSHSKIETPADFKSAFINLRLSPSEEELRMIRLEKLLNQITQDVTFYKASTGLSPIQEKRLFEFRHCMEKFKRTEHINEAIGCYEMWDALSQGDKKYFQQFGSDYPENFIKNINNEIDRINKQIEEFSKEDEIIVIENHLTFEEIDSKVLESLSNIDPAIKELSLQVSAISVKLIESDKVSRITNNQATESVFILGEMLDRIDENCEDDFFQKTTQNILNPLQYQNKPDLEQFMIGVNTEKNLQDLNSYKFNSNGFTYYLYKGEKKNNQDIWILGQLDDKGKLSFRYFVIEDIQPQKISISDHDDLRLVNPLYQQDKLVDDKNRKFYIQAEEGLTIKASETLVPMIGRAQIPDAKLVIGKVNMTYLTNKNLIQSSLLVEHDRVSMDVDTRPLNSSWSIGAATRYNPFSGQWSMEGRVRVKNLIIAGGKNSNSHAYSNVSYVLDRNFVTFQTDQKLKSRLMAGHQLKHNKGFYSITTDFNKVHELTLVLFLNP